MDSDLPPGWTKYTTADGQDYYHNTATDTTTWDRPTSIGADSEEVYKPSSSDLELTERYAPAGGPVGTVAMGPTAERANVGLAPAPTGVLGSAGSAGASEDVSSAIGGMPARLLAYAQEFFDVGTADVVKRLRRAVFPYPLREDSASSDFRTKPDFWGPFWISTTAILFLAATGNFAGRIVQGPKFQANYSLVSYASTIIYGCLVGVPAIIRAALYFSGQDAASINLRQLVCVYGYSLAPAIPASILCIPHLPYVRTLIVLACLGISLTFVWGHLWTDISVEAPSLRWVTIGVVVTAQAVIFVGYRWLFFSWTSPTPAL